MLQPSSILQGDPFPCQTCEGGGQAQRTLRLCTPPFRNSVITGKAMANYLDQVPHTHHLTGSSKQPTVQMCKTVLGEGKGTKKSLLAFQGW